VIKSSQDWIQQNAIPLSTPDVTKSNSKEISMPRNTSAVRSGNPNIQVIVRSERAHLHESAANRRRSHRKTAKTRGSYLPAPKILRIQQRYINGQNRSEIAREEKCDRATVARIVQFPEVQNFIAQMQQEFFGLVPDAMAAVRHALQVGKNPAVGYRILEGTGVAPCQGERLQLPESTAETGYERQARLIASVLLEGHQHMGVELPPEIEEALAKDSRKGEAF
jgi:hypothetical protein